jgi:cell division septation protein DedD
MRSVIAISALCLMLSAQVPSSALAATSSKATKTKLSTSSVKDGVDAWSRGDFEGAVRLWREPAAKGDPDAQFNLAHAYKVGRGVKQDLAIALDLYRQAASRGHFRAEDSYAHLLHYRGQVKEALPLLEKSSARGEPRSQYLLGTELFNGVNVSKDWVRAYALMTRASSAGLAPASRSLAQMDQFIPFEQRQQGMVLAGEIERQSKQARADQMAGFPINTDPPRPSFEPIEVPPSDSAQNSAPGFPGPIPAPSVQTPNRPVPTPPARPVRVAAPKPSAAPVKAGKWRIQLGAFGNETNATKLWNSLEARVNGLAALTPYLVASGKVTRLQAGPFASQSAAEAMCAKLKSAGQGCLVISN